MLRGLLFGSASGVALCALVLSTAALVSPHPGPRAHRPEATRPGAPVVRGQVDTARRVPDAVPRHGTPEAETPPATPPAPSMAAGQSVPPRREAGTETPAFRPDSDPRIDGEAAIPLPVASGLNRPLEDGEAVMPAMVSVARPNTTAGKLQAAPSVARDAPSAQTQSAARPRAARVTGFGAGPQSGQEPALPRPGADTALPTLPDIPPAVAPVPAGEATIDTRTVAPLSDPESSVPRGRIAASGSTVPDPN